MGLFIVEEKLCSLAEMFKRNTKIGLNEIWAETPAFLNIRAGEKG